MTQYRRPNRVYVEKLFGALNDIRRCAEQDGEDLLDRLKQHLDREILGEELAVTREVIETYRYQGEYTNGMAEKVCGDLQAHWLDLRDKYVIILEDAQQVLEDLLSVGKPIPQGMEYWDKYRSRWNKYRATKRTRLPR